MLTLLLLLLLLLLLPLWTCYVVNAFMPCMQVSASSSATVVAGALSARCRDNAPVCLVGIGVDAVTNAVSTVGGQIASLLSRAACSLWYVSCLDGWVRSACPVACKCIGLCINCGAADDGRGKKEHNGLPAMSPSVLFMCHSAAVAAAITTGDGYWPHPPAPGGRRQGHPCLARVCEGAEGDRGAQCNQVPHPCGQAALDSGAGLSLRHVAAVVALLLLPLLHLGYRLRKAALACWDSL